VSRQLKKSLSGLTLIELLVVLAVSALLVTLAAPSFKRVTQSMTVSSSVNAFLADARFARAEAMRRGGGVAMCRSEAPEAAQPTCATGSGSLGAGWASGWIVFHDLDNDGAREAGEPVLRAQASNKSIGAILSSRASAKLRFTATGRLNSAALVTSLLFGSEEQFAGAAQRLVCVSVSGRARVVGDGSASCSDAS
jgi:type IV fimbrial biogenesis protein FimT